MSRRSIHRRDILDAASEILVEQGEAQLTTRRLAARVGASTQVIYSSFEDKAEIIDALLAEGFSRLADALSRVDEPDPFVQLREMCCAYRRFAEDHPAYFRLMWRGAAHDRPSEEASAQARQAMDALLSATGRVVGALDGPARLIESAAIGVWSAVHGFCQLALSSPLPPPQLERHWAQLLVQIEGGLRAVVAAR